MPQKYWHIVGYNGTEKIYENKVKIGVFSENKIQDVLKALVAKAALDFDEIIGAYCSKTVSIKNDLLPINKDTQHQTYMCGDNPHFSARIIE